jgi:hypothetical protein
MSNASQGRRRRLRKRSTGKILNPPDQSASGVFGAKMIVGQPGMKWLTPYEIGLFPLLGM